MPIYEYRCENCSRTFTVQMSMSQHEEADVVCPDCQKSASTPQYSTFFAKTARKS